VQRARAATASALAVLAGTVPDSTRRVELHPATETYTFQRARRESPVRSLGASAHSDGSPFSANSYSQSRTDTSGRVRGAQRCSLSRRPDTRPGSRTRGDCRSWYHGSRCSPHARSALTAHRNRRSRPAAAHRPRRIRGHNRGSGTRESRLRPRREGFQRSRSRRPDRRWSSSYRRVCLAWLLLLRRLDMAAVRADSRPMPYRPQARFSGSFGVIKVEVSSRVSCHGGLNSSPLAPAKPHGCTNFEVDHATHSAATAEVVLFTDSKSGRAR
jgi:hypothetical protein